MLKLLGAILIIGSSGALGLAARQSLRARIAAIDGFLKALETIESEIVCRLTPCDELIARLAAEGDPHTAAVFTALAARIRQNDGLSLSYKWGRAFREQGPACGLREAEIGILSDAGSFLGRYDSEQQSRLLRLTARRLSSLREEASEDLKNKGSLYRTCGLTLGILAVIVLL